MAQPDAHASQPTPERNRDREFAALALPLLPTIARVASALTNDPSDADDLVQETFLRAYRHWNTFVPGTDCKAWLSTICRHAFVEQRRRDAKSIAADDQELENLAAVRQHNRAVAHDLDGMFSRLDLSLATWSRWSTLTISRTRKWRPRWTSPSARCGRGSIARGASFRNHSSTTP